MNLDLNARETFPFGHLIQAVRDSDTRGIVFLLSKRGPLIGSKGCIDLTLDRSIFDVIIQNGSLETIDIFVKNDPRVVPHLLNSSARIGNLSSFKHIINRYNPERFQVEHTITYAVRSESVESIDIVRFLIDYGVETSVVAEEAARFGRLDLLMWSLKNGAEIPSDEALSNAIISTVNSDDCSLMEKLTSLSSSNLIESATNICAENDDLDTLVKLLNPTTNIDNVLKTAMKNGAKMVFSFLQLISSSKL